MIMLSSVKANLQEREERQVLTKDDSDQIKLKVAPKNAVRVSNAQKIKKVLCECLELGSKNRRKLV